MVTIRRATSDDDPELAKLFAAYGQEYAQSLGPQDLQSEGEQARAYYDGNVLVACNDSGLLGCVAFEQWGNGPSGRRCRMKRMFVAPPARGTGLGRQLGLAVIEAARLAGFDEMCLDTTKPMAAATALYESLGFTRFEPDYEAPCNEVFYMRRVISS